MMWLISLNHLNNYRSRFQFLAQAHEVLEFVGQVQSFAIRHVKKEQNVVAHEHLAKHLHHSVVCHVSFPACVEHLIAQDCSTIIE